MVESTALEMRRAGNGTVGSNPTLSATHNPEAITTDGLRSCKAAMTELGNADKQEVGR